MGESDVEQAGDSGSFGAIHQLQGVLSSKQRGSDGVFDQLLTSSGPVAFLVFTLLNSLLMSCSMTVGTASSPTGRMSDIELLVDRFVYPQLLVRKCPDVSFNYFPKNPTTGSVNMLMSLLVEGCGPRWSGSAMFQWNRGCCRPVCLLNLRLALRLSSCFPDEWMGG